MGEVVTLRLAHSPDSDDLVMWWPLVGLAGSDGEPTGPAIDVGRYRFELVARDVEELNKLAVGQSRVGGRADGARASGARAGRSEDPSPGPLPGGEREEDPLTPALSPTGEREGRYDITAISCAAYPAVADRYAITACGGSFGEGYGPRVVVRGDSGVRAPADLRGRRVAVPGVNTSAFLAMSVMLGSTRGARGFEAVEMVFSEIPGAVARGEVDAGVLIHEAQLTFGALGLREVVNLGAWWGTTTELPLPLGLNVVRRDLDERYGAGTVEEVAGILSASVRYAVEHPRECREHLRANRGDRGEWDDEALVDAYLRMYVSALTVDMGERGRAAIAELLGRGAKAGLCAAVGRVDVV